MTFLVCRGFLWILVFLHTGCALESYLMCGKCIGGSSLTCPSYEDKHFSVKTDLERNALILQCSYSKSSIDFSLLEGCNFTSATGIKFKFCPFMDEFPSTLKTIGTSPAKIELVEIYYAKPQVTELRPIHLQELSNLLVLTLDNIGLRNISEDAFKSIPKLKTLHLTGNNLRTLSQKTFQPLSNLSILNLSNNNLSVIPDGLFDGLVNLKILSLWRNHIEYLPPSMFDHLGMLQNLTLLSNSLLSLDNNLFSFTTNLLNVNIRRNDLMELPEKLFKNCTKLNTVKLGHNNIENVPANLFEGATSLVHIDLSENKLESLPENLFSGLQSLKSINCGNNRIIHLASSLFSENVQLTDVDFSSNIMKNLSAELFSTATKVVSINFSRNKLEIIPDHFFADCRLIKTLDISYNNLTFLSRLTMPQLGYHSLKKIDLSNNQLTGEGIFINDVFAFNGQVDLEELDLSFNNFTSFPSLELYLFHKMKLINFEGNYLRGILISDLLDAPDNCLFNFKNNRIETASIGYYWPNNTRVKVLLEGNNFTCDCHTYKLIYHIQEPRVDFHPPYLRIASKDFKQESTPGVIDVLDRDKLVCRRPEYLMNQSLAGVALSQLTCRIPAENCTKDCTCFYRNVDNMIIIDCSNRNMTSIPEVTYNKSFNYTLDISGNSISSFQLSNLALEVIVNISLVNNQLNAEIFSSKTKLPEGLKFLDLRQNNFTHLREEFLLQLNQTETEIDVTQNPWICDCSIASLHNFIQAHFKRVKHIRNVLCEGSNGPLMLVDLTEEDICPLLRQPLVLTAIGVITALLVALAVVGSVSYYKYKIPLKVWLYKNRLCLCLIIEDELDEGKEYDAFVSFSHKDEEFVNEILVPGLENGDPKYKLCLHYRDWTVGEFIPNQIVNTVQNSRRTLVVLSSNFIESVWGQMEFRAAHKQAMEDKTNRVIIVVYGEMPPIESLDEELRHYVSLHTYLRWDHPRFWDNLRYAMPHPRDLLSKRHRVHNSMNHMTQFELTKGLDNRNGHVGCNGVGNGSVIV